MTGRAQMSRGDRRFPAAAMAGVALILGMTLLFPASSRAGCAYLDIAGTWTITQHNAPFVEIEIQQAGPTIHGPALYEASNGSNVHGAMDGQAGPAGVDFRVRWDDGTVGRYSGKLKFLTQDNRASPLAEYFEGTTFEEGRPGNNATWTSPQRQHFKCAADDGQQTSLNFGLPPAPTPSIALGRAKAPPKLPPVSRQSGPVAEVPLATPTSPKTSVCALAAAARARHTSDAASLEAQCRALSARQ